MGFHNYICTVLVAGLMFSCGFAPAPELTATTTPIPTPTPVPTPTPPLASITHGSQLTAAHVGPAAIGITSFTQVAGGALRDDNATSYGVNVAGTAAYDGITVTGPHLLIQGKEIDVLDIYASKKIVIRGSRIRGGSFWAVNYRSSASGGLFILYSDIGGRSAGVFPGKGIAVYGSGGAYIYRNNITNAEDGIEFSTDDVTVLENYVYDFANTGSSHNDGIGSLGGEDRVIVSRNKVLLEEGQTGAFNFAADGADISDWVVDRNYIAGGGYTCYCGGEFGGHHTLNFKFTNNIFGLDFYPTAGAFGPAAYVAPTTNGNVFQGNSYSNGTPMTP